MSKRTFFVLMSLLFSLFLISSDISNSNIINFEKITQRNGLSQGSINCILQDEKGFMWFGTQSGLNKYDGYKFEVFVNDPDNSSSISFNEIQTLFEDSKENLWIGTSYGLNRFVSSKKKFIRYFSSPNKNSISNDKITSICEDKNGYIWVGTRNGLNRYNYESDSFKRYSKGTKDSISDNRISSVYYDKEDVLWVGTYGGGLNKYLDETDNFENYFSKYDKFMNFITSIYQDHSGEFWVGTRFGGLILFNRKTGIVNSYKNIPEKPNSLSSNQVNFIIESKNRMLWVGTPNGLNRFNRRKENFYIYKNDISNPQSLSFDYVSSIFEDKSGILWVGTMGRGLNKYTKRNSLFKKYIPEHLNKNSLNNSFVYPIIEDKDQNLWIGTQGGGVNKINSERNKYSFYKFDRTNNNSISFDYISSFFEDKEGVIWIGTFGNGINKYIKKTNTFKRYINQINAPFSISNIRCFLESETSPDILWLGSAVGGLLKFYKKKDIFELFFRPLEGVTDPYAMKIGAKNKNLNSNIIYFMYEAPSRPGYIWVSSEKGLNGFDIKQEKFYRFGKDSDAINNYILQGMIENSKYPGILWIGSLGRGLIKFNIKKSETEKIYTKKDGLPDNVIYSLLEDKNGHLWISTNRGISEFDLKKDKFFNYDENDGLQGLEFNGNSAFRSSSGEMFFGGTNGFNSFNPDKIIENKRSPAIYITNFKVFGESIQVGKNSILKEDISDTEEIILSYDKNTFSFEFVALDYTAPKKNKFMYKLENFDDVWIEVDYRKRFAQYMNLNPGDYVFKVKGSNNDGVWNENERKIKIIINPPFWQTWSFRFSLLFVVGTLFFLLYKKRMSNVSTRLRLEAELNAAHKAQMSIMPQADPELKGFDISGLCVPANEVGGDFYDYLWLDKKKTKFGIAIGDVSGKAMKAAMTAIMTNGILFSQASESGSIKEIMTNINKPIYLKTEKQVFTALCLVSIDIHSKNMSFTNAGLSEPILKSGKTVKSIKNKGIKFPLGIRKNIEYLEKEIQLISGDTLLLYTDGVSEAMNSKKELYSVNRLLDLFKNIDTDTKNSKEIIDIIMDDVQRFSGDEPQWDDITIVIIKVG